MNFEKIRPYYIGHNNKITMEQAAKYDVITNWSCDKGHEFWSTAQFVEDVIDKDLCPCCMKLREEPIDGLALDRTQPNSLFNLDYELFGKELSTKFIYTDTCINTISFKSTKGLSWNIDGKVKVISPNKMVYKMMEKKQADLKKRYELGAEDSHHFEVIKCEACGKYLVHYRDYKIREKEKCPFCKEFILHPFSFGRWLDKHKDIDQKLIYSLSEAEYKMIRGYHKDDEVHEIVIPNDYRIDKTNIFCITHDIYNF